MDDTPPNITSKMCEMIRLKSPVDRLKMGAAMYETSKYLIIRSILENDPHISESDLRKEIFLKFYGHDYDLSQQEKIIKHINDPKLNSKILAP
ncbi:hypothetical protein [Parachlamydia acanthamoebae]|uniref:hypothetical protein n=1 Tax=Parachlamydia acanthamoebae TaxID=83552 RepID=UPI0024E2747B|nr:hypothetical protein [Parachlamydia acanthamoebae]